MNNALKLVAANALAAQRPTRLPSQKQSEVTANLSLISRTWRTLTDQQRIGWTALGQVWSPNGKLPAKGLIIFQSLNGVRLNTNQGNILPNAPSQPDFIGKLPGFSVTAERNIPPAILTLTDSAPPQDNPGFTLYIESTSFSSPVLVLATRPLSAGVTKPDPKQFRQIACFPTLTGPITDLSGFYYSQFAAPAAGMKVAIQIVPVTANGFRGNPFTQIATVVNVG